MQLFIKAAPGGLKTRHFILIGIRRVACIMALLGLTLHTSAAPSILPPVDEVALTNSVFIDNPQFGKDPFFPKSARAGRFATINVSITNAVEQFSGLSLKGISGVAGRRLAIINNRTFEVGEEMPLRVANQMLKVRCLEIRDKSVTININGQTKELFLGQRL